MLHILKLSVRVKNIFAFEIDFTIETKSRHKVDICKTKIPSIEGIFYSLDLASLTIINDISNLS